MHTASEHRCVSSMHKVAIVVASVTPVSGFTLCVLWCDTPVLACVCLYTCICVHTVLWTEHRCVGRHKVAIVVASVTSVSGSITASPRHALIMPIYSPGPAQWGHCTVHNATQWKLVQCTGVLSPLLVHCNVLTSVLHPLSVFEFCSVLHCTLAGTLTAQVLESLYLYLSVASIWGIGWAAPVMKSPPPPSPLLPSQRWWTGWWGRGGGHRWQARWTGEWWRWWWKTGRASIFSYRHNECSVSGVPAGVGQLLEYYCQILYRTSHGSVLCC